METEKFAKPSINTSKYAIYYPQITSLFSENYIRQMASHYINALLQACLEVAVHVPPYVINSCNFVNNGLFQFLNSHDAPPEHTVFQEPPQEKVWYSKVRQPSRPSDVAETTDNSSEHFTNNSHTVSYHMKWRPLLYCPLAANHDKLSRRRNIPIRNVSVGSAPPCRRVWSIGGMIPTCCGAILGPGACRSERK